MRLDLNNTTIQALLLCVSAFTLTVCDAVPLTAPNNATMEIQANPLAIAAVGGQSTITITAFKAEGDGGGTVPNGTQIFLTTDLGIIEERVGTTNGVARATLQSDGRAGQATVIARSGTLESREIMVEIGAGGADDVITVVANPSLLGPQDFTSEIVATVTDGRGNPVANVPLLFSTNAGTLTSQSSVIRTNANGQASDRLTFLDDGTLEAVVTVSSGGLMGSVTVSRAVFDPPLIDFVSPSSGNPGESLTVTVGGQKFQPGATVSFGVGVRIDVITFVNAETLSVEITVDATAGSGSRDVTATNPDNGTDTLTGAFTVN